jgi:hypothetical protein
MSGEVQQLPVALLLSAIESRDKEVQAAPEGRENRRCYFGSQGSDSHKVLREEEEDNVASP